MIGEMAIAGAPAVVVYLGLIDHNPATPSLDDGPKGGPLGLYRRHRA